MAADGGGFDGTAAARARAFAALDRRLDPTSAAPLALGLSGGSDSLALLLLTLEWARSVGRRVLALTVDHGLNPDSARWTSKAGASARALGADWRALAWQGPKPPTGLPAAARQARHSVLADAARAAGTHVLLLGHTADDVAESELIRRETPSHGRLQAWAPSPVWPQGRDVFVLRPLLEVRRTALRDMLAVQGLGWLEDPANADGRFARARARHALALLGSEFPGNSEERAAIAVRFLDSVEVSAAGVVSFDLAALSPMRLAYAVACAAGRPTPPSGAGLARLAARFTAGDDRVATLGGARIVLEGGKVILCREPGRRRAAAIALMSGEPQVYDGRFELVADAPGWQVAPLAGHASRLPRNARRRLAEVPGDARPSLPVLLNTDGAARLPRPFGEGPGVARELVGARLSAALGRIDSEHTLTQDLRARAVHGAETHSILSWVRRRDRAKPSLV